MRQFCDFNPILFIAVLMNFLTAHETFSLYPYSSFIQKVAISCRVSEHRTDQTYIAQGFKSQTLAETIPHISYCPETVRRPGDAHTWKIKILPTVFGPVAPVESNTWRIRTVPGSQYAKLMYKLFYHPKLSLPVITAEIRNVQRWFDTERKARRKREW